MTIEMKDRGVVYVEMKVRDQFSRIVLPHIALAITGHDDGFIELKLTTESGSALIKQLESMVGDDDIVG